MDKHQANFERWVAQNSTAYYPTGVIPQDACDYAFGAFMAAIRAASTTNGPSHAREWVLSFASAVGICAEDGPMLAAGESVRVREVVESELGNPKENSK